MIRQEKDGDIYSAQVKLLVIKRNKINNNEMLLEIS